MQVNPYIFFNGDCQTALKFYEKTIGAKIEAMMTHGGTPAEKDVPAEWRDKVLHARMVVGDGIVMASDAPPGHYEQPKGFFVSISVHDLTKAETMFNALAENGTIQMPFQQTFWAAGFGMCVDRFGIPWMVNCDQAQ
jgi:PhnB protein